MKHNIVEDIHEPMEKFMENNHWSNFVVSVHRYYKDKGYLTQPQYNAIARMMETMRQKELKGINEIEETPAGDNYKGIWNTVNNAVDSGLKRPTLRLETLKFSWATKKSKNPDYVYVSYHDKYCGKISPDGEFFPLKNVDDLDEILAELEDCSKDLLYRILKYGKATGNCALCGKMLTVKESLERGVGPICANKWKLIT